MSSHRAILSERVKLKYCGITSLEDALDALAARADYLGFVFAVSPRHIDPAAAAEIIAELPAGECRTVGVFKDQSVEEILACVADCPVDVIQVHGDYSLEDLRRIKAESGCLLSLAVFPLPETFEAGLQLAADPCVDYILLDARGEPFDWALCEEAKALGKPVLLAGGLTPSIAALAAANARPYALDVASGIEDSPGRKNAHLMLRFSSSVMSLGAFSADEYNDSAWAHAFTQNGRFGAFAVSHGGAYVPETLIGALEQLEAEYRRAIADDDFQRQLGDLLANYAGRPTPLYHAKRLSEELGAQVWLKREDLLHTGAHKLNNCLGQALLAQRMGRQRIVAETGAGQHGVGTATVCALLGLDCVVYMGAEDVERQAPNVQRMKLLGAEVRPVSSGTRTLKDATSEAIRDWVSNVADTYYLIGSTVGPHPYPSIVREFQRVIGTEARRQILTRAGRLPDAAIACVGGGSNALGLFHGFIFDQSVKLHGAEAGGEGLDGAHAATLTAGRPGVLHGTLSYLLQDAAGQVEPVHSISAGLDYPGVGPEHSFLKDVGRVKYHAITDAEALAAFQQLARLEGILPALESSHALALAARLAAAHKSRRPLLLLVNLSGRGDKDLGIVSRALAESAEVQP